MEASYNLITGVAIGLFCTLVLEVLVGSLIRTAMDIARRVFKIIRFTVVASATFAVIMLAGWGLLDILSK